MMAPFPWNLGLQQAQRNNGKVIPPRIKQQQNNCKVIPIKHLHAKDCGNVSLKPNNQ
jgi:hypothetical protein